MTSPISASTASGAAKFAVNQHRPTSGRIVTEPGRIACVVPFCRRTRHNRDGVSEWICGDHWMAVSKTLRRRKARLSRAYTRRFGDAHFSKYEAGSPQRIACVRLARLFDRAWNAAKRQAIERAGGI